MGNLIQRYMSTGNFQTLCLVVDSQGGHKHLFCAQKADTAQSVLSVKTPLNSTAIDKYFLSEADLGSIKQSLVEKPTVYRFDQVFRSSA